MKPLIQRILQKILGYDRYLWLFTWYKLKTLRLDRNENDFFHFLTLLKDGSIVLDIGANLGLMTYFLSKCDTVQHVHSFEPMPNNLKVLSKVKKRYYLTNVSIHDIALGNSNGTIELVLPVVKGVKKQGLSHVMTEKIATFNKGETITAEIRKLDNYEDIKHTRVDAIKIDVENYEYEVFLGAKELISQHHPLIYCELWDNQNRYDCFELLETLGYAVFFLDQGTLLPFKRNLSNTQNFFFIPQES